MFESSSIEYGDTIVGVDYAVPIAFRNAGRTSVALLKARTSCSCKGHVAYPSEPVGPGQTGRLTVTFTAKSGDERVPFLLETSAGTTAPVTIHYRGAHAEILSLSRVDFGEVSYGEGARKIIHVLAVSDYVGDRDISVDATPAWLQVSLLDPKGEKPDATTPPPDAAFTDAPPGSGASWRLLIAVRPEVVKGFVRETIGVRVRDNRGERLLTCQVSARVVEELHTLPERIIVMPGQDECTFTVCSVTTPFRIVGISPKGLAFRIGDSQGTDRQWPVTVSGLTGPKQESNIQVEIVTTHPRCPILAIPIERLATGR